MDPGIAGLDAFFADALVGSGELDLISMFAFHFGLLQFRQGSMNQVTCDRAFPNRRCYPFDIARAGITHCKHAGKAGFEHLWRAREWPRNGWHDSVGSVEISSSNDESLVIHGHTTLQPIGSGRGTRHDKQPAHIVRGSLA